MIAIYMESTGSLLGMVRDQDFQALIDLLEEEGLDDQDYNLNQDLVDLLEESGAAKDLVALLRTALGAHFQVNILYEVLPRLIRVADEKEIGLIFHADLKFLQDQLEMAGEEKNEFFLSPATIRLLRDSGAETALIEKFTAILGNQHGIELRVLVGD